MITISHERNRHKMLFSNPGTGTRGFTVYARTVKEIHEAIDHYHRSRYASQHTNNQRKKVCPLCRKD